MGANRGLQSTDVAPAKELEKLGQFVGKTFVGWEFNFFFSPGKVGSPWLSARASLHH